MPYMLHISEPVMDGARRIGREQVDNAMAEINDETLDRHEAVHQVRKRCKKIRGLLRLIKLPPSDMGMYRDENIRYRDISRVLSVSRDAEALIESHDKLVSTFSDKIDPSIFAAIRKRLIQHQQQLAVKHGNPRDRLDAVFGKLKSGREQMSNWRSVHRDIAVIKEGSMRTYRRGRKALKTAIKRPVMEEFHELRKQVKYHLYHCRLLSGAWEPVMRARSMEIEQLAELLGDDHDLALLRRMIVDETDRFKRMPSLKTFLELAARRRADIRAAIRPMAGRIFAEKPGAFARRITVYWKTGRQDAVGKHF